MRNNNNNFVARFLIRFDINVRRSMKNETTKTNKKV